MLCRAGSRDGHHTSDGFPTVKGDIPDLLQKGTSLRAGRGSKAVAIPPPCWRIDGNLRCATSSEARPDLLANQECPHLRAGHAELAELFDQGRAAQRQEACSMGDGAAGTLQGLADEAALDECQVGAQVDAVFRQSRRRLLLAIKKAR